MHNVTAKLNRDSNSLQKHMDKKFIIKLQQFMYLVMKMCHCCLREHVDARHAAAWLYQRSLMGITFCAHIPFSTSEK